MWSALTSEATSIYYVKYTVKYISAFNELVQLSFMFEDIAIEFQKKLLGMGCTAWIEVERENIEE